MPRTVNGATDEETSTGSPADRSFALRRTVPEEWKHRQNHSGGLFDRLHRGEIDRQTAWSAYRETLQIVLKDVTTLLRTVDADEVVITSDHGNAFGEWGLFGHPVHMPFYVLREVPYLTTRATSELEFVPKKYHGKRGPEPLGNADAFAEKLEALGYLA